MSEEKKGIVLDEKTLMPVAKVAGAIVFACLIYGWAISVNSKLDRLVEETVRLNAKADDAVTVEMFTNWVEVHNAGKSSDYDLPLPRWHSEKGNR